MPIFLIPRALLLSFWCGACSNSLQPSKRQPEYWQNLGSSKSRTKNQEAQSREIIEKIIDGLNEKTVIAFTDGSCLGNPGPCGTGACLYMPGYTDPILHKQPVTSYGSILLGELIAIKMVINTIQNQTERREIIEKIHIFSDSQCVIGHLTLRWEAKTHKASIQEVKSSIQMLKSAEVHVDISWTPGHSLISKVMNMRIRWPKKRQKKPKRRRICHQLS